jgi:hypothetical protein
MYNFPNSPTLNQEIVIAGTTYKYDGVRWIKVIGVQTVDLVNNTTGILPIAKGGTASSTSTGSGSVVLATSPTIESVQLNKYTVNGVTAAETATTPYYTSGTTTLAIPLDGRVYDFDFPDNNIIIDFVSPPTAPITADTVLNLKQRSAATFRSITSWSDTLKWPGNVPQTMPQTANARMKVVISFSPSGVYDISATWVGA